MLPPFYSKGMPEDGIFAANAQVIEAVGAADLGVYFFHIPRVSRVAI
jgi:4-hydroxy-tetrahydrodipicolinate synthase